MFLLRYILGCTYALALIFAGYKPGCTFVCLVGFTWRISALVCRWFWCDPFGPGYSRFASRSSLRDRPFISLLPNALRLFQKVQAARGLAPHADQGVSPAFRSPPFGCRLCRLGDSPPLARCYPQASPAVQERRRSALTLNFKS